MTVAQLLAARTTAGARYVAAVAELHAAFVDLAAIEGALANGNVDYSEDVITFGPALPQNISNLFAHPIYAPIDPLDDWSVEFKQARDAYIAQAAN
jgi:hypothetical protein